jgi:hypothetical protein
LSLGKT